jgi:hypothetical protein
MEAWLSTLQLHGPIAAMAMGLVVLGKIHAKSDDERHRGVSKRVQRLEDIQRADIRRVHDSIERVAQQNTEILKLLAQRSGR